MDTNPKGFNIRDVFWNYPDFFSQIIRITNPLFFMLLAFLLGYIVFSFFTSESVHRFAEGRDVKKVVEGTVGGLISTNPMYVTENSVDRDFYKLVYEKFIDIDTQGDPVANIAVEWEEDEGLEYVFRIRDDILWHDGSKLTAADIVWNFETSILLANNFGEDTYGMALEGVEIEQVGDHSVRFVLSETNATFWEAISVYIIPKYLYQDLQPQDFSISKRFTKPIGCGIYKVDSITERGFTLSAFDGYWETPNIQNYKYLFFENYHDLNNALKNNEIDIINTFDLNNIENLEEYPFFRIEDSVLYNRQKIIYFNTRREKYSDDDMREAISLLIDKDRLIEESRANGVVAKGPIPPKSWAFNSSVDFLEYNPEQAVEILESLGYVKDSKDEFFVTKEEEKILSMEISFLENELNSNLVSILAELLREEGVLLRLRPLNYDQVMREILPTRDFELLLYEIEVTVDPDQYNLWHSLRVDHPLLNISGYNYSRVDILLERARTNIDKEERKEDYFLFQRYLIDDAPVVFLYHPQIFFIMRENLKGFDSEEIVTPCGRYENVHEWYWEV